MKKLIVNLILVSLTLLVTVGFSAWYIIYTVELKPEKVASSILKYFGTSQEVIYNGQEQFPVQKAGFEIETFDPTTLTFSYKLSTETNFTVGKPINANVYDVKIQTNDGRECKVKFTIKPKQVRLDQTTLELNYIAGQYRQWASMETKLRTMIKFVEPDNLQSIVTIAAADYTIDNLDNGVKIYAQNSLRTANIDGSTYNVNISTSTNYEIIGNKHVLLKYKTCLIGTNYYTIEDALAETGNITLIGDASTANSYVVTSFSKVLPKTTYNLNGRSVYLPFENGRTDEYINAWDKDAAVSWANVYSGLYVPNGITLNLNSGTNIVVSSVVKFGGEVTRKSVLMNDGVINVNSNAKISSYGFVKGKGIINVHPNGEVVDVFRIKDWPGADEAVSLKNKNAFPVINWSVHNISCDTKVYKDGRYNAMTYIVAVRGAVKLNVTDVFIVGDSNTPNCLFSPNNGSAQDYVLKKTIIPNDNWTIDNQVSNYKNQIFINGKYRDKTLKINADAGWLGNFSFETSTAIAVPISYYDFILNPNSHLIFSSSSYILYENSKILIEKGATLDVTGSAYVYSLNNSKLTVNGKLSGSGAVATTDSTAQKPNGNPINTQDINAEITIVKFGVTNCVIKKDSLNIITINGNAEGFVNSATTSAQLMDGTSYQSIGSNPYYFVSLSSINRFYIDFVVPNQKLEPNVYQSIKNTYTITTNELNKVSQIHYEFAGWYLDATHQTPFVEHTFNTPNERITLYAKMNLRVYTFRYNTFYNDGTTANSVNANLSNQNPSFTFNDFVDGKLKITTTAEYQGKFFDGWYLGVNKENSPVSFLELDIRLLEGFLNAVGIDVTSIPLYCEFSDTITYEIRFLSGHPTEVVLPVHTQDDIIDVTAQTNQLLPHNNNSDYKEYFIGWYTDVNYGKPFINNQTSLKSLANKDNKVTLYGKWVNKLVITVNHKNIGAAATTKYATPGQNVDLTQFKYNDNNLYFANAYDISGTKLTNNMQIINSNVTYELEYEVDVTISHSGKGAVTVWNQDQELGNIGTHRVIIGTSLRVEIGGYFLNRGFAELKWYNGSQINTSTFEGQNRGTVNHQCPITYQVSKTI